MEANQLHISESIYATQQTFNLQHITIEYIFPSSSHRAKFIHMVKHSDQNSVHSDCGRFPAYCLTSTQNSEHAEWTKMGLSNVAFIE